MRPTGAALFALVLAVVCPLESRAQQAAEKELAKAPDYGPAFKKLIELGLPDISGMEYGKFTSEEMERGRDYDFSSSDEKMLKSGFIGNAWRGAMDEKTKSHATILLDGVVIQSRTQTIIGKLLGGGSEEITIIGKWRKVDLNKDLNLAIKAVNTWEGQTNENSYMMEYEAPVAAEMILLAAQAWRVGEKDKANELVWRLLTKASDAEMFIDAAVAKLAYTQYEAAVERLEQDQDWRAYYQTMNSLVERFPRGWSAREAVAMVAKIVEPRAAADWKPTKLPAKPRGLDVEISPKARDLVGKIRTESGGNLQYLSYSRSSWLVGNDYRQYFDGAIAELLDLKLEAIPVLLAMLDDDSPTLQMTEANKNNYYDKDTQPERLYHDGIARPMTMREIAAGILIGLVTKKDDNVENPSENTELLRAQIIAFYNDQVKKSPEDRLFAAVTQSESQIEDSLLEEFLKLDKPELVKKFEAHLLKNGINHQGLSNAANYVSKRGPAALEFYESYEKAFRKELANPSENSPFQHDSGNERAEMVLKSMKLYVTPMDEEKLIDEVLTNLDNVTENYALLKPGAEKFGFDRAVKITQRIDLKAKPEQIVTQFKVAILALYFSMESLPEDESLAVRARYFKETKDQWLGMLSDDRTMLSNSMNSMTSVAATGAMYFLELSEDPAFEILYVAVGPDAEPHFIEVAKAMIEAKDPPATPVSSSVSKHRREEILAALKTKPAAELLKFRAGLSLPEKLVYVEELGKLKTLPQGARDTLWMVTQSSVQDGFPLDASLLTEGGMFTSELLKTLNHSMPSKVGNDQRLYLSISSSPGGGGLMVVARVVKPDDSAFERLRRFEANMKDQVGTLFLLNVISYNESNPDKSIRQQIAEKTSAKKLLKNENFTKLDEACGSIFTEKPSPSSIFYWVFYAAGPDAPAPENAKAP